MTAPEQAVQHCLDAYNKACAEDDARHDHSPESLAHVNRAYRRAMPFLTPATIDAFLACVTHGLVLEIFTTAEAAKLLYATQIAVGSRRSAHQQSKPHQTQPAAATPSPLPLPAQTAGAPYLRTASPSGDVGDLEPKPAPSPTHSVTLSPCNSATPAPTPLPPAATLRQPPAKASKDDANYVQAMLEQILSGKTIPEPPLAPWKKAPPSPLTTTGQAAAIAASRTL
ncbi:hypothetical protein [Occallatibacter riparius]|uniref:Uncharacterized protein n=1 Tax=Occallatibacter riparius TaxID=1002689 RepID=A0A9J7BYB1_9BACT|nr:hypothetical protein [Occallatibacter riparius]UWZ86198.1 hypothetical protein MOP44_09690 [Occallatibacter riparius]